MFNIDSFAIHQISTDQLNESSNVSANQSAEKKASENGSHRCTRAALYTHLKISPPGAPWMSVPLAGSSTGNALFRPCLHDLSTAQCAHGSRRGTPAPPHGATRGQTNDRHRHTVVVRSKVHLGDHAGFVAPSEHASFLASRGSRVVARAEPGTVSSGGEFQPLDGEGGTEAAKTREVTEKPRRFGWFPMHDFCLTLPWGLFVALGGLAGFAIAGSTKSLIFGGGMGTLLMALGAMSLKKWKANESSAFETIVSALISTALGAVMGKKWMAGGSFIPAGLIACGAALMCVFYAHNLASGGNPAREASSEGSKDD